MTPTEDHAGMQINHMDCIARHRWTHQSDFIPVTRITRMHIWICINAFLLIYASISWQNILRMKWNKMNLYLWMWQRACMICVVHTRMVIVLYCLYLIESLVYLTIYHIEMSTLKIWIEYCEVLYLKPWLAEVIMSWPWMTMDMCSVKCWTCLIDYNSCLSNWVSKFEIKWQIVLKTFHLNLWFV